MIAKGSTFCRYALACRRFPQALIVKRDGKSRLLSSVVDRAAKIVVVGPRSGDDYLDELVHLPHGAKVVAQGNTLHDILKAGELEQLKNVLRRVVHDLLGLACFTSFFCVGKRFVEC